jgi:hypothetical protein
LLRQNPARSLSAVFPWRTAWMAGTSLDKPGHDASML